MANTSALSTMTGRLKIAIFVFAIIAMGIHADNYDQGNYSKSTKSKQEFYLAMLIISFIVALAVVVELFAGILGQTRMTKMIDVGLHVIIGVLLGISWILQIVAVSDIAKFTKPIHWTSEYKEWLAKAICALVFGGLNTILYFVIAFFGFRAG